MNTTPPPRSIRRPSRWRPDLRDERGSLPMLMMVILVGVVLSTFMVSVVVSQTTSTRFSTSREQSLNAAQAGIDVALARIRASTSTGAAGTPGTPAGLPCWTHRNNAAYSGSVVSGATGNQVGSGSYSVFVDYYTTDPVIGGLDPVANPNATMVCSPGYGTFDPATGQPTPSFALITSTGTVAAGGTGGTSAGRTLVSTYVFRVDNRNISGGLLRLYPANVVPANPAVCLQAATSTPNPATATPVTLAACSTTKPPAPQQVFAYRTDLTIQLVSSVVPANPDGVCLDGGNPLADANPVVLRKCNPLDPGGDIFSNSYWWQQWSFDDNGHFRGSTSTSRTTAALGNFCLAGAAQTAGTVLRLAGCTGGIDDQSQAWIPSPDVGAGAATQPRGAPETRQYVNFGEFGRCMDVTDQNTGIDHFILYPCKQNPAPNAVAWNQVFTTFPLTATYGQLRTVTGGKTWCVTSPGTLGDYVRLYECTTTDATLAPRQRWVQNDGNNALPYSAKFTLVDAKGYCLGLTVPVAPKPWSTLDVETCDGSREQKWNATADLTETTLQNTVEK